MLWNGEAGESNAGKMFGRISAIDASRNAYSYNWLQADLLAGRGLFLSRGRSVTAFHPKTRHHGSEMDNIVLANGGIHEPLLVSAFSMKSI